MIGNDLFAYNRRPQSKSRDNFLRLLRGKDQDFVLNEYSRSYLIAQQLPQTHLAKLHFEECQSGSE